jgi:peptidoglycan hydrolase-like protein with peptidoglycan-binding domain
MGAFYESIKNDLDKLDSDSGGPSPSFGVEYNSNPTVVRQVQTAINKLGYLPALVEDGSYGPMTAAGVKWLQAKMGVAQDGLIGDQTLGTLGITPPGGVSTGYVTGAVTGAAAQALAALQQEFGSLLSWSNANPQPITQGKGIAPGFQATKASVINSFVDWTTPLEGFVPHLYIDALGYVTTGMGNLVDPIGAALVLPWKNPDGSRASQQQITDAWNAVDGARSDPKGQKQTSGPATHGGGSQGNLTNIRITKADVQALVASKLKSNEAFLAANLLGYAKAPADAQMATHSMSWAMGPGFAKTWTQFRDAFSRGDYAAAADQSHMQGTGIDMRNTANKLLLKNAAQVVASKKNPDTLYYISGLGMLYGNPMGIIASIKAHPGRTLAIAAAVATAIGTAAALALRKT